MVTAFLNVANNAASLLAAEIAAGATSLSVPAGDGAEFPSTTFHISIDDEIILCTSRTTDVLTVTRAQEGTIAAIHLAGAEVRLNITAKHIDDLTTAVNALEVLCPTAAVLEADFDAYTILYADVDDTPAALTIAASRIVGRKASGGIAAMTGAEVLALLTGANLDVGAFDVRGQTVTADSLTSGRVPFASTNGLLVDDADFTFATDTLTVTKIGAFQAVGAIDFNNQNMTNVDVDSGDITGTTWQTHTLTLTGNLIRSGAHSLTLITTATTSLTLPTTGTLATLAGTEELDNKTLDSSVAKGTWTASGTWTIPAVTLSGTMTVGGQTLDMGASNLTFTSTGGLIFYTNTSTGSSGPTMIFQHISSSPNVSDRLFNLTAYGKNASAQTKQYGNIELQIADTTAGNEDGKFILALISSGADKEIMTLTSIGALSVGIGSDGSATAVIGGELRAPHMKGGTTTDGDGADITIAAGKGTGAGDVGQIIFQTPRVRASGTTLQTLTTIMTMDEATVTIAGDIVMADTKGIFTEISAGDYLVASTYNTNDAVRIEVFRLTNSAVASGLAIMEVTADFYLVEKAAAGPDIAGRGQFWIKDTTPNELWFTPDDGVDKQVAEFDIDNGEMIVTSNQTAVIETANTPHAFIGFSTGVVEDFSFVAGITGAITVYADYSGTVAGTVNITCNGHGLVDNDIITIRGTTNYNGIYTITKIGTNNFYITHSWDGNDGASDFEMGAYLLAGTGTAGEYDIEWNESVSETGGAGSVILFCPMINTTAQTKASAKRKVGNNDVGSVSGGGHIIIAVGNRIWFYHQSDGTNDLTIQIMNLRFGRLA